MIQGHTNRELGIEFQSWIRHGSKNRTGVRSLELLHVVVTMIQGHANGGLGNESRSWIGIGSNNRTGVRSLELYLHEVVTPDFKQIDELSKVGLAKVGGRSDIQFRNEWSTRWVDEWLRGLPPATFKEVGEPDQDKLEYSWRLLKSKRLHLSFHCELPDGVDLISAKGRKSKGWQDSKPYFGMSLNYHLVK